MTQKLAVVTGANRGIGFEVCRQLAQKGMHIILTARDVGRGQEAVDHLRTEGFETDFYPLDVTDQDNIKGLVADVKKKFGRLDVLINNAGIFPEKGGLPGLKVSLDMVKEIVEVNTYGPLQLCQAVIPLMQQHNYGRIVNVSSRMAQLAGMGGNSLGYRISKTALNVITVVLANEVKGSNILINTMSPGWVRTEMGGPEAAKSIEEGADTAVWLAMLPDDGPTGGFFEDRQPISW